MVDTHAHLWFDQFKGEVPEVIARAKVAGVHTMINVGCNEESSRAAVAQAKEYEGIYASVGLHPTDVKGGFEDMQVWMRELLGSSKKIVAIGETGIDYFHEPFNAELQQQAFRQQCLLAQEFDLPVIVHLRATRENKMFSTELTQAEKDCLEVLDEVGMKPGKVLFHCFSGDRTMAEEVLQRGWHLSFSGVLTYPKADELREVAKMCPLDRMVVETDCPFLPPQSRRGRRNGNALSSTDNPLGRISASESSAPHLPSASALLRTAHFATSRNEPAFVVETAQMIAELKQISIEMLEKQLDGNARSIFRLS